MGNPDLDSYFDAVYAETIGSVSRFVVSHAARFQDTEDIVQNVYTRFYKRISEKGYADIESTEAFLINIAKFECRSMFAGFRRRKDRDIILSDIDEEQSAAIEAEMSRDQKLLEDIMADKILARQIFDDIMSGDEMTGSKGFGYDPIFMVDEDRSMAELDEDEKNQISHRARAFEQLAKILKEKFG